MKDFTPAQDLLDKLRKLSTRLPDAQEYTMVGHPAFRVGKKPFAVVGLTHGNRPDLSINHGFMAQAEFLEDDRFSRTPYMAHNGWVTLEVDRSTWDEIVELVEGSYRRVAGKRRNARLDES